MHSALLIADYIIAKSDGTLTPLQVIKLVYIAHGYTLALLKGKPLIKDRIEAWKYGPVIPILYDVLKVHGGDYIPNLYYCNTRLDDRRIKGRREFFDSIIPLEERRILDKVMEAYIDLTVPDLIEITHEAETPWAQYYDPYQHGVEIPNDAIREHYEYICNERV